MVNNLKTTVSEMGIDYAQALRWVRKVQKINRLYDIMRQVTLTEVVSNKFELSFKYR